MSEHVETVVIGGGQAGLAVGLLTSATGPTIRDPRRRASGSVTPGGSDGIPCDCSRRAGTTGCPGCHSRVGPRRTPTKDEAADYLEAYAATFELPVRLGVKVDRLPGTGAASR